MSNKAVLNGGELDSLAEYARKVVESKGYRFYKMPYLQGIRDAEKYHGISAPTFTTRKQK